MHQRVEIKGKARFCKVKQQSLTLKNEEPYETGIGDFKAELLAVWVIKPLTVIVLKLNSIIWSFLRFKIRSAGGGVVGESALTQIKQQYFCLQIIYVGGPAVTAIKITLFH